MTQGKEIVIAIRQFSRNTGATRNAEEQAIELVQQGHRVTILAEKIDRAKVVATGATCKKMFRWPIKGYFRRKLFDIQVQRWVHAHKPDMVISHGDCVTNDLLVMHNATHLAFERMHGRKINKSDEVARIHDNLLYGKNFKLLLANSRKMKEDFIDRYGIDPNSIKVFRQPVNTIEFNIDAHGAKRDAGRACLELRSDCRLVGLITSGNFTKRNVTLFLKIASIIIRNHSDIHFVVAGGEITANYSAFLKEEGIQDRVTFVKPMADVHLLYHALDVFVLPAKFEEFGRVVLEALACGTPAVVSDQVGASEIMVEHGLPHVIAGYEAETWVDAIVNLLENPELRERVSAQSADVARLYTREKQMEQFRQVVNSVISRQV